MSDRRQQWEAIKQEDPALADFLTCVTQVFDKPKATSISLASGVVIESGAMDAPKLLFKTKPRFIDGR